MNLNKLSVRVPLVLFPLASGMLASISITLIKGVSESIGEYDLVYNLSNWLNYVLLISISFTLFFQLFFLNQSLRYYNQLEVVPVYQASVIIFCILCGGIIYEEFTYYEWWRLTVLLIGALVCAGGILVILKKYKLVGKGQFMVRLVQVT